MEISSMTDDQYPHRSVSVLIADDSPMMQDRLKVWLETIPGLRVVGQVVDARSVDEMIHLQQPEVVILDMHLPGGGLKTLEMIKANPNAPIVVVFTAFGTPFHREKCLLSGADYFFDKTSELKEFQAALRLLASQR
jgi:DNA-binding NarL/FixJ family response regulator